MDESNYDDHEASDSQSDSESEVSDDEWARLAADGWPDRPGWHADVWELVRKYRTLQIDTKNMEAANEGDRRRLDKQDGSGVKGCTRGCETAVACKKDRAR